MHWIPEGSTFDMPEEKDGIACARVSHFGNWLRIMADFEDGSQSTVLVTIHLKA